MDTYIYVCGPKKDTLDALIVGPTNSGKTQYILNQLRGFSAASLITSCSFAQPLFLTKPTTASWTTGHALTLSTVSNTR